MLSKSLKAALFNVMSRLASERGMVSLPGKTGDEGGKADPNYDPDKFVDDDSANVDVTENDDNSMTTSLDKDYEDHFNKLDELGDDEELKPKPEPEPDKPKDEPDKPGEEPDKSDEEKLSDDDQKAVLEFLGERGYQAESVEDVDKLIADSKGMKTYQRKLQENTTLSKILSKDPRYEALVKQIVLERLGGAEPAPEKPADEKPKTRELPETLRDRSAEEIRQIKEELEYLLGDKIGTSKPDFDPGKFKTELLTEFEQKQQDELDRRTFAQFQQDKGAELTPLRYKIMTMLVDKHNITDSSRETLDLLLDNAIRLEKSALQGKATPQETKDKPLGAPSPGGRKEGGKKVTLETAKTDADYEKVFLRDFANKKGW